MTGNLYQKKDDAARFILVADSKEAAHGVCEKFILDQWDGKQRTVKLPDNCGRISLTPGSDEVSFTPFRSMLSRISKNRT